MPENLIDLTASPPSHNKPPRPILSRIFAFAPNRDSLGGTAYFIAQETGNILIDCPAWHASVNYTRFISGLPGPYMHYYGDELGLRQTNVVDEIEDVDWAGRDGCRSPMPWLADAPNGGFTAAGVKPFLPVDPNFSDYAVDLQELDLESHLARIRAVFLERMNSSALQKGDFQVLQLPEPLVGYVRSSEEESLACLFNTSAHKYSDSAKGISLSGYECKLIDFGQINI